LAKGSASLCPRNEIMIGKVIAHYRIIEKIGQGGMGEIYRAEDARLERQVALKFLPRHLTEDREARTRFEREAKAAAALNHPNIVTVYEIGEHEGQVFIAMEYVEGQTLKDIVSVGTGRVPVRGQALSLQNAVPLPLAPHPLPIAQVTEIASQIASSLAAAHAKGIVHRDVKPANIFITREDTVRILDFGIAKLGTTQTKLTKTVSTVGTVAYMSPEQALGREVDACTDIWSLGVVFYEMTTGQLPFHGEYKAALIYSVLNEPPRSSPTMDNTPESLRLEYHGFTLYRPESRRIK
jgi:serine/threonine protein kinase